MTAVKVCGVTRESDARMLVELGVQVVGLNFWPKSKRFIGTTQAKRIASEIRNMGKPTQITGVFVNASAQEIADLREEIGLDWVQLHGDESVDFTQALGQDCIKALPLAKKEDLELAKLFSGLHLLVDSHSVERGGSGQVANWQLARELAQSRDDLWLAGGLRADNVKAAIEAVRPYGVDVASGVESSPGIKDRQRVLEFLAAMKETI